MKPLWQEALEAYDRACLWRALRCKRTTSV
jgi:hypothetical protein